MQQFDFFIDEDMRDRRLWILCVEKSITPALVQSLFRVRENAIDFHQKKIETDETLEKADKRAKLKHSLRQIREIKWSELNVPRSFIAKWFLENFFHFSKKWPLPLFFINIPFEESHTKSMENFIVEFKKIIELENINISIPNSIAFLDNFTTSKEDKFELDVIEKTKLSRCYRIDSRSHDLIQLSDILLWITTYKYAWKETTNKSKLRVLDSFEYFEENFIKWENKKHSIESVYIV